MTRDPRGSQTWLVVGEEPGEEGEVGPGGGAEGVAGEDREVDLPGAELEWRKCVRRSWISFDDVCLSLSGNKTYYHFE